MDAMQFFRQRYKKQQQAMQKEIFTEDGFENFVSRLGVGHGVQNSLSKGNYYFNMLTRNRVELEAAYRGSWIVGAIIDSKAEDMTRAGIDVDTSDAKEQVTDVLATMEKLKVWDSLCDNQKWGDLYGGAIGVLQIEGQDMSTPLEIETVAKGQFKGIVVYDRWQVNPVVSDLIDEGPDLGLPRIYQLVSTPLDAQPSGTEHIAGAHDVHHSRVIRSIGIKLPFWQALTEQMWGESVLERLWDRLIAFDNATMSCASLVDRANLRQVGIENFRQIIAGGGKSLDGLVAMFDMMREYQTNEGLTLLDKNDVYASTAYSFAGLSDMLLQFGQQLSGSAQIPLVRLFGQSPSGLNSTGESDMRIYYDGINAKQEVNLRKSVDLILRILWRSVTGDAAPEDLSFSFKPLWQMTPLDKATMAKTNAETVAGAYEAGLTKRSTSLEELRTSSANTGVFGHITDEDIAEADEEMDPPPGETETPAVDPVTGKPNLKVIPGGASQKGLDPVAPNPQKNPATTPTKSFGGDSKKVMTNDSAINKPWYKRIFG